MTSAGSAANASEPGGVEPTVVASVVPLLPAWRLDRVFDYLASAAPSEPTVGSLVRVPFGHRNVRAVVVAIERKVPERELQPIAKVLLDEPVASPPLDALARWIAVRYGVPLGKALDRFAPPRVRIARRDVVPLEGGPAASLLPSYSAGRSLLEAIESGAGGTWCLNALPAHDRSQLIAELVAAAGRADGSALVAVPEVRFGSQVVDGLRTVWPELVRIDSSQDDKDRAEAWLQMARGHGLACGGRSTVFAPAPGLRLIVIDEEHHRTFKEDRSPRYDARHVAIERARLQGAVCVLVSETPRVETGAGAARAEIGWVEPSRAERRSARPLVEIVEAADDGTVSPALFARVRDALRAEQDVALLAPRRGYARVVWCVNCKRSLRCPRCEAALVFDRAGSTRVRCPRCSFASTPPAACPSCGADEFRYVGAGSERLAEQLAKAFPRARVRRMDPEVLAAGELRAEPSDIYVTTWIGTKPEIRPEARLVAILDADALIRRPGFRAAELGFQALGEMARWAGPAAAGGRLVIQTSEPTHHAVQAIVRGDPRFFLEREIELRRDLRYPPFAELVRVWGPADQVDLAAVETRAGGALVLGPIDVDGGPEREFLAKTPDAQALMERLRPLLASSRAGNLRIDTDPR
jgi:primosomal protein N'